VGQTGTWVIDPNALGEDASTLSDSGLKEQATSLIKESPFL
ncbi:MAG: transposase, partial [Moorea sp. SIO3H5]|nr:transposase [Moorena sp. SIO3H5]